MLYGDLTYLEIREMIELGSLVIVPTGCTEQQGLHLPTDLDTFWVTELATAVSAAAEERGVSSLVVPTLPFGPTPEHRGYGSGYIDLPQALHEEVVYAVLSSLAEQGFGRLVLLRGCGRHRLDGPAERLNRDYAGRARAFLVRLPLHEIWCRVGDATVPGGHADSFATSVSLYLRPESVRRQLVRRVPHGPVDWGDPDLDLARISETGVVGDPTHADAELGRELWQAAVAAGVEQLMAIADEPITPSAGEEAMGSR